MAIQKKNYKSLVNLALSLFIAFIPSHPSYVKNVSLNLEHAKWKLSA